MEVPLWVCVHVQTHTVHKFTHQGRLCIKGWFSTNLYWVHGLQSQCVFFHFCFIKIPRFRVLANTWYWSDTNIPFVTNNTMCDVLTLSISLKRICALYWHARSRSQSAWQQCYLKKKKKGKLTSEKCKIKADTDPKLHANIVIRDRFWERMNKKPLRKIYLQHTGFLPLCEGFHRVVK